MPCTVVGMDISTVLPATFRPAANLRVVRYDRWQSKPSDGRGADLTGVVG